MKRTILVCAIVSMLLAAGVFAALGGTGGIKERGFIPYTPDEARELAYSRCSQCHKTDKISRYCMRCGPPLIVIVHNMNTLTRLENERGHKAFKELSAAQSVAVAQFWNATVGNWEDTWREEDLIKLLEGDTALTELARTPVSSRPIEAALKGKSAP